MSSAASTTETGLLKVVKAITWVVYVLATAAELFLTFMFFLQLFGANPDQAFVAFIYRWGSWFARPFQGIIPPTPLGGIAFVNWNAVVAFAAYAVLAWLLSMAMGALRRALYKQQNALAAQPETTTTGPVPVDQPKSAPSAPASDAPVAPPEGGQQRPL